MGAETVSPNWRNNNMLHLLHRQKGAHSKVRTMRKSHRIVAALAGTVMAASGAYAATNWVVGLVAGSAGVAQSAAISNLTITATASPTLTNLLYPGSTGDVQITISNPNPNPYPVSISALTLPSTTTYATGYTSSALTTTQTGCLATTPSDVIWAATGTTHTLTTPLVVAASGQSNNPLTVTLTAAASMSTSAPAACANTYFSMPSISSITALSTTGAATTSPATDS